MNSHYVEWRAAPTVALLYGDLSELEIEVPL
jgi:hypothetical protein